MQLTIEEIKSEIRRRMDKQQLMIDRPLRGHPELEVRAKAARGALGVLLDWIERSGLPGAEDFRLVRKNLNRNDSETFQEANKALHRLESAVALMQGRSDHDRI